MTGYQQFTRWIGSMTAIAVGLLWLELLGAGGLDPPPWSVDGAVSWLEHRETSVVVFALLRLCAVAVGWYLLLITAFGGVARALRLRRVSSAVSHLTLPFARSIVGGVTLLGVMGPPPPVAAQTSDSMVELPPDPTSTTAAIAADTATLHLLPETTTTSAPPPTAAPAPSPMPEPTPTSPNADSTTMWVVQPGESFWSIAAEHLADINGAQVSEREVGTYWRQVIEINRSRLANPADADLLFIGQELELPAVTSG